jgi:hypothetical protein
MSEMMMRQNTPDFDEMKDVYLQLERDNPSLGQQVMADPHPWNKAYQIAQNHTRMQTLGATNVAELETKLRAEIMAELQAQPAVTPNLPASLADAQSSRVASNAPRGPLSLEEILNGKG